MTMPVPNLAECVEREDTCPICGELLAPVVGAGIYHVRPGGFVVALDEDNSAWCHGSCVDGLESTPASADPPLASGTPSRP